MKRILPANAHVLSKNHTYIPLNSVTSGYGLVCHPNTYTNVMSIEDGPEIPGLKCSSKYWLCPTLLCEYQECMLENGDTKFAKDVFAHVDKLMTPPRLAFVSDNYSEVFQHLPIYNNIPSTTYDNGYIIGAHMCIGFVIHDSMHILYSCSNTEFKARLAFHLSIALPNAVIAIHPSRITLKNAPLSYSKILQSYDIIRDILLSYQESCAFCQGIMDGYIEAFKENNLASLTPTSFQVIQIASMLLDRQRKNSNILKTKDNIEVQQTMVVTLENDPFIIANNMLVRGQVLV